MAQLNGAYVFSVITPSVKLWNQTYLAGGLLLLPLLPPTRGGVLHTQGDGNAITAWAFSIMQRYCTTEECSLKNPRRSFSKARADLIDPSSAPRRRVAPRWGERTAGASPSTPRLWLRSAPEFLRADRNPHLDCRELWGRVFCLMRTGFGDESQSLPFLASGRNEDLEEGRGRSSLLTFAGN